MVAILVGVASCFDADPAQTPCECGLPPRCGSPCMATCGCCPTFGSQCVVVAIDARRRSSPSAGWDVYTHGGRTNVFLDVVDWANRAQELGAGEILLTSMDRDGTRDGYDIDLCRAVSSPVKIPVIASGGAGRLEHFYDALTTGGASAVLAASLFHYGELSIEQVKSYLRSRGVEVR